MVEKPATLSEAPASLSIKQRGNLVKMLGAKSFDPATPIMIDGEAVSFDDGSFLTFGDLASRTDRLDESGAKVGHHYPVICSLSASLAWDIAGAIFDLPWKPKSSSAKPDFQRKASAKPSTPAKPGSGEADGIEVIIAREIARQFALLGVEAPAKPVVATPEVTPAKPVLTLVKTPAKPVTEAPAKPVAQMVPEGWEIAEGKKGLYLRKIKG